MGTMDKPEPQRPVEKIESRVAKRSYWPIWELTLSRMRVFYREPAAVFWVYGFPLVMALSLGTAFRENPKEQIAVDIVGGSDSESSSGPGNLKQKLVADPRFKVVVQPAEDWKK